MSLSVVLGICSQNVYIAMDVWGHSMKGIKNEMSMFVSIIIIILANILIILQ